MIVSVFILFAYFVVGTVLLVSAIKNLRRCGRAGSARLFAHSYDKEDAPVGFWLSIVLSVAAIAIGLPMIIGSAFGVFGLLGSMK